MLILAVDVSTPKIRAAIYQNDGSCAPEQVRTFPFKPTQQRETLFAQLAEVVRAMLSSIGAGQRVGGISLAFGQPCEVLENPKDENTPPALVAVDTLDAKRELQKQYTQLEGAPDIVMLPVWVRTQAQAFALGENYNGLLAGKTRTMHLTLNNGVGAAFLREGRLLYKQSAWMPAKSVIHDQPLGEGTVYSQLSRSGLEALCEEVLGEHTSDKVLHLLAVGGSPQAKEVLAQYGARLCELLAPYLAAFTPQELAIGGSLAKQLVFVQNDLEALCAPHGTQLRIETDIAKTVLDGLYAWGLQQYQKTKQAKRRLTRGNNAPPMYQQLRDILKEQVEMEEFAYGELFWSEKQLQDAYNVSRMTVRLAIGELVTMGYLYSERGKGSTVCYKKPQELQHEIVGLTEKMEQNGIRLATTFSSIARVEAGPVVGTALRVAPQEEVYVITRVREANGLPFVYSITYLQEAKELPLEDAYYTESLYQLLRREYEICLIRGRDTFEAVLADKTIADNLKIKIGSPVVKRTRKAISQEQKLLEYSVSYFPGDKYKYTVEL